MTHATTLPTDNRTPRAGVTPSTRTSYRLEQRGDTWCVMSSVRGIIYRASPDRQVQSPRDRAEAYLRAVQANHARLTPTVTAHDLVDLALTSATDFCNDIRGVGSIQATSLLAATAIDMVTDGERHPTRTRLLATSLLADRGWAMLEERERDETAALIDGIEAGDLDRDGSFIPWSASPR